jgi:hypothetical protein
MELCFYSTVPCMSSHKATNSLVKSYFMQIMGIPYSMDPKRSFQSYMYSETLIQSGKQQF